MLEIGMEQFLPADYEVVKKKVKVKKFTTSVSWLADTPPGRMTEIVL